MKKTLKILLVIFAAAGFNITLNIPALRAAAAVPEDKAVEKKQDAVIMKVNFYRIDRAKADKGEFLGTAVLKKSGLEVNVKDPALEKLLKEPYGTIVSEKKDNIIYDKRVTYQPGTEEHLKAFAVESYKFGYIGEIEKNKGCNF